MNHKKSLKKHKMPDLFFMKTYDFFNETYDFFNGFIRAAWAEK